MAKFYCLIAALVVFAPMAFATLNQAAQIVAYGRHRLGAHNAKRKRLKGVGSEPAPFVTFGALLSRVDQAVHADRRGQ